MSLSCGDRACRTVTIGDQTWMAENLNYEPSSGNSWCYDDKISNCNKYGKLYDWATAMGINTSYNKQELGSSDVKRRGICPEGWHLPSNKEWNDLKDYVGNSAGYKLRATCGWYNNGVDTYGFSALPGGTRNSDGKFYNAGDEGYWWTATEWTSDAHSRNIGSTLLTVPPAGMYLYRVDRYRLGDTDG
jgi:uncharacterized protein (TIGR02145 family)